MSALTAVLAEEMRRRDRGERRLTGPVATELDLRDKTWKQLEEASLKSPLERLGRPDDVAGVVAFLASPAGEWVSGQVVVANGAFS